MTTKKRPLSKRAKAHRQRLRRDRFGRLALAVGDYLTSVGWSAVVVASPRIQQQPLAASMNYEFVVEFTGSRRHPAPVAEERD